MLWTLRDGKLLFAQTYLDLSEALQDARLEALDAAAEVERRHVVGRPASGIRAAPPGPRVGAQRGRGVAGGGRLSRTRGSSAAVRAHRRGVGGLARRGRRGPHARGGSCSSSPAICTRSTRSATRSSSLHTSSMLEIRDGLLVTGRIRSDAEACAAGGDRCREQRRDRAPIHRRVQPPRLRLPSSRTPTRPWSCPSGPRRPARRRYHGPDGVRTAFEDWFDDVGMDAGRDRGHRGGRATASCSRFISAPRAEAARSRSRSGPTTSTRSDDGKVTRIAALHQTASPRSRPPD